MDGLWTILRATDWNSLLSAAIGGGFALADVYYSAMRYRANRQQAETVAAELRGLRKQIHGSPPRLTSDACTGAAAREGFISRDVADLPLSRLVAQVQHAVAVDDRAGMYVLAREFPRRLSAPEMGEANEGELLRQLRDLAGEIQSALADRQLQPFGPITDALLVRASKLASDARRRKESSEAPLAFNPAWMPAGAVTIPDEA